MNPFKKHDVSEFEGVFQPLGESQRHPSVLAAHDQAHGTQDGLPVKDKDNGDNGKDVERASSVNQYSAYTIEGLRAEIDSDIAASGHDTIYDRTSKDSFLADCWIFGPGATPLARMRNHIH